jgi:hypothetical protein
VPFLSGQCLHLKNNGYLYAVNTGSTNYPARSGDGGVTWEQVTPPNALNNYTSTSIWIDDGSVWGIIINKQNSGSVNWRSSDGGMTWASAPALPFTNNFANFYPDNATAFIGDDLTVLSLTQPYVALFKTELDVDLDPYIPNTPNPPDYSTQTSIGGIVINAGDPIKPETFSWVADRDCYIMCSFTAANGPSNTVMFRISLPAYPKVIWSDVRSLGTTHVEVFSPMFWVRAGETVQCDADTGTDDMEMYLFSYDTI